MSDTVLGLPHALLNQLQQMSVLVLVLFLDLYRGGRGAVHLGLRRKGGREGELEEKEEGSRDRARCCFLSGASILAFQPH